jgi:hypothetical protein
VSTISRTSDRPQPHQNAYAGDADAGDADAGDADAGDADAGDAGTGADAKEIPIQKEAPTRKEVWMLHACGIHGSHLLCEEQIKIMLHSSCIQTFKRCISCLIKPTNRRNPISNPRECSTGPTSTIMSSLWLA